MALTPDYDSFARAYKAGENQVVYTRLAADLDTPVSLMLKLTGAQKDAFMLESVTGGEVRGRYSIIGMKPDLIWRCDGETSSINRQARFDPDGFQPLNGNPMDTLRALIAESRIDLPADLPQAAAGLFGYLGYDTVRLVEHLPDVNPDPLGLPDALMTVAGDDLWPSKTREYELAANKVLSLHIFVTTPAGSVEPGATNFRISVSDLVGIEQANYGAIFYAPEN